MLMLWTTSNLFKNRVQKNKINQSALCTCRYGLDFLFLNYVVIFLNVKRERETEREEIDTLMHCWWACELVKHFEGQFGTLCMA